MIYDFLDRLALEGKETPVAAGLLVSTCLLSFSRLWIIKGAFKNTKKIEDSRWSFNNSNIDLGWNIQEKSDIEWRYSVSSEMWICNVLLIFSTEAEINSTMFYRRKCNKVVVIVSCHWKTVFVFLSSKIQLHFRFVFTSNHHV